MLYMISLAYKMTHCLHCLSANHNPEWQCVICTGITLELHCSQLIRIKQFFHVYYYPWNLNLTSYFSRSMIWMTHEQLKLLTDICDFTSLFNVIWRCKSLRIVRVVCWEWWKMSGLYCAVSVLNVCEPHRHWSANWSYLLRTAYLIFKAQVILNSFSNSFHEFYSYEGFSSSDIRENEA